MPFLYETHMHTCQGSACGKSTGKEHARFYKERGFTGIIMTDHFFGGNTAVDRRLRWEERVDLFWRGFEEAKETGSAWMCFSDSNRILPEMNTWYTGSQRII